MIRLLGLLLLCLCLDVSAFPAPTYTTNFWYEYTTNIALYSTNITVSATNFLVSINSGSPDTHVLGTYTNLSGVSWYNTTSGRLGSNQYWSVDFTAYGFPYATWTNLAREAVYGPVVSSGASGTLYVTNTYTYVTNIVALVPPVTNIWASGTNVDYILTNFVVFAIGGGPYYGATNTTDRTVKFNSSNPGDIVPWSTSVKTGTLVWASPATYLLHDPSMSVMGGYYSIAQLDLGSLGTVGQSQLTIPPVGLVVPTGGGLTWDSFLVSIQFPRPGVDVIYGDSQPGNITNIIYAKVSTNMAVDALLDYRSAGYTNISMYVTQQHSWSGQYRVVMPHTNWPPPVAPTALAGVPFGPDVGLCLASIITTGNGSATWRTSSGAGFMNTLTVHHIDDRTYTITYQPRRIAPTAGSTNLTGRVATMGSQNP